MEGDRDRLEQVAGMLEKASKLLRNPTVMECIIHRAKLKEGVVKADLTHSHKDQELLRGSSSSGLCRRLNKAERLRSVSSSRVP